MTEKETSLFVMVGDPSADKHASKLLAKLKEVRPDIKVWGIGGSLMAKEGAELMYNCQDFSALGLEQIIGKLSFFKRMGKETLEAIKKRAPSMVLLIDFGGYNLRLAEALRKQEPDLPIYYFISPQVWASRPWRKKTIAKNITKMLCIFPFEEGVYKEVNVPVSFVGHPVTRNIPPMEQMESRTDLCKRYGMDENKPVIGIFPGSRNQEMNDMLPPALEAVKWLLKDRPELQFIIALASDRISARANQLIEKHQVKHLLGKSLFISNPGINYPVMKACDLIWAKAGTTTLEVTIFGKPMVAFYRAGWLSYLIFCVFKQLKRVAWPNLLSDSDLVPELMQLDCRADQLVRYTSDLLDCPGLRKEVTETLLTLRQQLGERDYAENCVSEIVKAISENKEPKLTQVT
jgi:lipid-A-disaccharide synthase